MSRSAHSLVAIALLGCGACWDPNRIEPEETATRRDGLWIEGEFPRLPERRGDLVATLAVEPVATRFTREAARGPAVRAMVRKIVAARTDGRWCDAVRSARSAGYELSRFFDEGLHRSGAEVRRYFVIARDQRGRGEATIVVNPNPSRNMIIEAPHSDSEANTRREALELFRELGARAVVLNGANRCASTAGAECTPPRDGVSVCGSWEPNFRRSDVAHWPDTAFQDTHVVLEDLFRPYVIQLHQFEPVGAWWAVVSDGMRTALGERHASISVRLRDALKRQVPTTVAVGSCQCEHDGNHPALCGDLNLQGRYTNQAIDGVCTTSSRVSSDRFIHLEQHHALARESFRVAAALREVVGGCDVPGASDCPSTQRTRDPLPACD
jgi:hypothetical protein